MNRTEKEAEVAALQDSFKQAENAFLVGFSGLTVTQVNDLRRRIRESSCTYRVVKNRLALRAIKDTLLEQLREEFTGPTGIAFNSGDPVPLAKLLSDFAKDNPALLLRVAVVDQKEVVTDKDIVALAKLPGLQELRAQILSIVLAPATKLARLLSTPGTQLARVLEERRKGLSEQAD